MANLNLINPSTELGSAALREIQIWKTNRDSTAAKKGSKLALYWAGGGVGGGVGGRKGGGVGGRVGRGVGGGIGFGLKHL